MDLARRHFTIAEEPSFFRRVSIGMASASASTLEREGNEGAIVDLDG
jgi:hypothetical protein